MDIEFSKCYNNKLEGEDCMRTIRKVILAEIWVWIRDFLPSNWSMKMQLKSLSNIFCEMDSSAPNKFSRHIIAQMPHNLVFANTDECGNFVKRIKETINSYIRDSNDIKWKELIVKSSETEDKSIIDSSVYSRNHNFRILGSAKYEELGSRHLHL